MILMRYDSIAPTVGGNAKKDTEILKTIVNERKTYHRNPPHIAHICKSHEPAHNPKFAKECNFSRPTIIQLQE